MFPTENSLSRRTILQAAAALPLGAAVAAVPAAAGEQADAELLELGREFADPVARYHEACAAARGRGDEASEAVDRAMDALDHQAERIIAAPAAVTITGFGIKAHAMAWPVADWWTDDNAGACERVMTASIEQQIAAAGLPLLRPDPVWEHVA